MLIPLPEQISGSRWSGAAFLEQSCGAKLSNIVK